MIKSFYSTICLFFVEQMLYSLRFGARVYFECGNKHSYRQFFAACEKVTCVANALG